MPPGGGERRFHHHRRAAFGASLAGFINAEARTETELRSKVCRFFGSLLALFFLLDIGSALAVVWISCYTSNELNESESNDEFEQHEHEQAATSFHCVNESIVSFLLFKIFHFTANDHSETKTNNNNNTDTDITDHLGDFVVLAVVRCLFTLLLLWLGIKFGKETTTTTIMRTSTTPTTPTSTSTSTSTYSSENRTRSDNSLMEPLLECSGDNDDTTPTNDDDSSIVVGCLPVTTSSPTSTPSPPLFPDDNDNEGTTTTTATTTIPNEHQDSSSSSSSPSSTAAAAAAAATATSSSSTPFWNSKRIRKTILLLVFVSCTFYQVYAGLRVATFTEEHNATFEEHNNNNNADSGSSRSSRSLLLSSNNHNHNHNYYHWLIMIKTILLCSTILWINIEAYIVQTLIVELTRNQQQGELLFLPSEIHRHPLYLETNHRNMSMHWCDLCQQRISTNTTTRTNTTTNTNTNTNTNNNNAASTTPAASAASCYRCALCDFDICIPCSRRNDAAIVGENVLRGDSGVRTEKSLTTSDYIKRSIQVAGKSEWPWLVTSFILLGLSCISKLLLPHFQGKIIDKVIPTNNAVTDNNNDNDNQQQYDKKGFIHYIMIYLFVMLLQGAISTLYSAIFTLISRRLKFTIRNILFEKILIQDVAYYDGTESGRLLSRLTNDLDLMMSPIQSSLSSLLSNLLILVGGLIMCFLKSYKLSMLAFVCIGPISYCWEQYAIWSKGLAREMLSYWAEGNSIASQALMHIRTVKAFGCEESVMEKYSSTNQMALNCGIRDAWGNGITSALTGYLDLGTGVLILYFGGLLVYRGEMSVGDLVTYQLFWNMMNNSYQNLQGLITSFTRSAAGAEKVFSLFDSIPDIDPSKGNDIDPTTLSMVNGGDGGGGGGQIEIQNISFYYQMRPDNIVLEDFSLTIPAGKTIALVGRSGGGKSTIIQLLLRFYDPKQGCILLDGKPYPSMKVHQLRRLFGVVTQETELFALTVEENIAYGLNKDNGEYKFEDVVEAAKNAYAHEFICEMKDGYQTRIGERGNRISGGQRQRIAIARVFLRKPKIILLDEATSALDENSQEAVHNALSNLIKESNATVVMVAHRLSTVKNADSICVIDKGQVLEQGTHDELVDKNGIYASMVSKNAQKKGDMLDHEEEKEEEQDHKQKQQKKKGSLSKVEPAATDSIDALLAD